MNVSVNGEPVPETTGGVVRWEDTPNRHAYCDGEIARLRAERDKLAAELESVHAALGWADHQRAGWRFRTGLPVTRELGQVTMIGARCDAAADIAGLATERDALKRQLGADGLPEDWTTMLIQRDEARAENERLRDAIARSDVIAEYERLGGVTGEQERLRGQLDHACKASDAYRAGMDEARAKRDQARKLADSLARITTAWTRGMYCAWIDCCRGDVKAAIRTLSEGLDGYDSTQWNGTETGAEWWERTKAEEGL